MSTRTIRVAPDHVYRLLLRVLEPEITARPRFALEDLGFTVLALERVERDATAIATFPAWLAVADVGWSLPSEEIRAEYPDVEIVRVDAVGAWNRSAASPPASDTDVSLVWLAVTAGLGLVSILAWLRRR